MVRSIKTLLVFPIALLHYVIVKHFKGFDDWELSKSFEWCWYWKPRHGTAEALEGKNRYFERERNRLKLPKKLYEAAVYMEYKKWRHARDVVQQYLQKHPGNEQGVAMLAKIDRLEVAAQAFQLDKPGTEDKAKVEIRERLDG